MALAQDGWNVSFLGAGGQETLQSLSLATLKEHYVSGKFKKSRDNFVVLNRQETKDAWVAANTLPKLMKYLKESGGGGGPPPPTLSAPAETPCPTCGTMVAGRFCSNCGFDMKSKTTREQAAMACAEDLNLVKAKPVFINTGRSSKPGRPDFKNDPESTGLIYAELSESQMKQFSFPKYAEEMFVCMRISSGLFGGQEVIAPRLAAAEQKYEERKNLALHTAIMDDPEMHTAAIMLWAHVHAFLRTLPANKQNSRTRPGLIEDMMEFCFCQPQIVTDELIAIILKQLTSNGQGFRPRNDTPGFLLLDAVLARVGPSVDFRPYVKAWLQRCENSEFDDPRTYKFIRYSQESLHCHEQHPYNFLQYAEKRFDFNRQYGLSRAALKREKLLKYSPDLFQPLHRLDRSFRRICADIWKALNAHIQNLNNPYTLIIDIIANCKKGPKEKVMLLNELYCYCIKQSRMAPDMKITLNCYKTIFQMVRKYPPRGKCRLMVIDHCGVMQKHAGEGVRKKNLDWVKIRQVLTVGLPNLKKPAGKNPFA